MDIITFDPDKVEDMLNYCLRLGKRNIALKFCITTGLM